MVTLAVDLRVACRPGAVISQSTNQRSNSAGDRSLGFDFDFIGLV